MGTFLLVFAAGAVVGLAELLSRHRDYPVNAAFSLPSLFYVLLNGGLSVLALVIVSLLPPDWLKNGADLDTLKTTLAVGFGAAAFFRSSFFKLSTPDGEVSVGPGLVIDIFLEVIDDSVDRMLGERRLDDATRIMKDVVFTKAQTVLPTTCFAALKRLSAESQQQAALQIRALSANADMDEQSKAVALGLAMMSLTGKQILQKAVSYLGPRIK